PSDDFSREKAVTYFGAPAELTVDVPGWESRARDLWARFRGQAHIQDSEVTLQAVTVTRWLLTSEGTAVQTGRNYVRVFMEANARADARMEIERLESFDAATFGALGAEADMRRAADSMVSDLKALR